MIFTGCSSHQITGSLIIAHRGASWYAAENTIHAFLLAWEQGYIREYVDNYLKDSGK